VDIAIMIEGQMGVNWVNWKRVVRAVEDLGFAGLYRSDHFTNPNTPDQDSLELWVSLVWVADNTERIEFGQLVSPVSFRHPVWLARQGYQVDDLSGGRFKLGVGAGWQEREHNMFGFPLLSVKERLDRLEEGLQVITSLIRSVEPVSFEGEFYSLKDAHLKPESQRTTPILVGGNGKNRTLPMVAKYADEWNAVFLNQSDLKERLELLDQYCEENDRSPSDVKRSMMTGLMFGRDDAEFKSKSEGHDAEALRERGMVVGTPSQVQEQLDELAETGIYRVMLQWFDLDDMDGLEALAKAVL
jgi:F420-dependent oxidoreductase-like protein